MIKFFRKFRQNLLLQGKISKYLLYAIGEIILVVIGILIALQVSNWNQKRVEQNTINDYFAKLTVTLEEDIKEQKEGIDILNSYADDLQRCLEILNNKNEADIEEFKSKIGILNDAYANDYSMELFDEFMSKGYLSKIDDPVLKSQFERVKVGLIRGKNWDGVLDNDYVNNVSPFIQDNLNYSDFQLPSYLSSEQDKSLTGPKVDYSHLFGDLKAWNAIYSRLLYLRYTIGFNNGMLKALVELKSSLDKLATGVLEI